jgi:recombination protein RecT
MPNELTTLNDDRNVRILLERQKEQFAIALARHVDPDRFVRIALTVVRRNPELLKCDQSSFLAALMECAQLGLEPDSVNGLAYLLPFREKGGGMKCQLIPGYRGLVQLARRSGQISEIYAEIVQEHDEFSVLKGTDHKITHVPNYRQAGEVQFAYAVAKFKDGGLHFEVMPLEEIQEIRKRSRASGSGPWVTDFAEMAKKTALRRLCKLLPLSAEFMDAIEIDDRQYSKAGPRRNTVKLDIERYEIESKPELAEEAPDDKERSILDPA